MILWNVIGMSSGVILLLSPLRFHDDLPIRKADDDSPCKVEEKACIDYPGNMDQCFMILFGVSAKCIEMDVDQQIAIVSDERLSICCFSKFSPVTSFFDVIEDRIFRKREDLDGQFAFAESFDEFALIDNHDHLAAH